MQRQLEVLIPPVSRDQRLVKSAFEGQADQTE